MNNSIHSITILQHNVMHWKTNKQSITLNILDVKPNIALLNSHCLKSNESLKLPGCIIYRTNTTEEANDGSAIAIKNTIQHKFYDFLTDVLAVEIDTTFLPIIIATMYLPPRRPYLSYPDIYNLMNNNIPTYLLDLIASHTLFGNSSSNTVGRSLVQLINNGNLIHLGPHYPTFIG